MTTSSRMLSDIVDIDGGMVVRDGEIERITESVDGRERVSRSRARRWMKKRRILRFYLQHARLACVLDSEPRKALDSKNRTSRF